MLQNCVHPMLQALRIRWQRPAPVTRRLQVLQEHALLRSHSVLHRALQPRLDEKKTPTSSWKNSPKVFSDLYAL